MVLSLLAFSMMKVSEIVALIAVSILCGVYIYISLILRTLTVQFLIATVQKKINNNKNNSFIIATYIGA